MTDRPPDAVRPLLDAIAFAARAHRHQLRKDGQTPYASHPFRVCLVLRHVFGIDDPQVLTAAVLHESNGPKGYERPLVDHPKEADGMISRGNVSEKIYIPPLATVIGGAEIDLDQIFAE